MNTRQLREDDWETLQNWWSAWPDWQSPPKEFLPDNGTGGIMVEKDNKPIIAGFMYLTNSKGVLLEYIVSDPEYREDDRDSAIELLLNTAEQFVKNIGCKFMFTVTQHDKLIKAHEKLGWKKDPKPSHELIKVI